MRRRRRPPRLFYTQPLAFALTPSYGLPSPRIDIGLDLSSYALQQDALDKLYYDPARQRERNMLETLAAQEEFVLATEAKEEEQSAAAGGGTRRQIREWTLQGTELREEIVPSSASSSSGAPSESSTTEEEESPPLLARPIESDLFRDNQLIHSWIERYRRDDPLVLPGDPDLGLNASQTKAIAMALGDRLSLIQGVRSRSDSFACCCAELASENSHRGRASRRRSSR